MVFAAVSSVVPRSGNERHTSTSAADTSPEPFSLAFRFALGEFERDLSVRDRWQDWRLPGL